MVASVYSGFIRHPRRQTGEASRTGLANRLHETGRPEGLPARPAIEKDGYGRCKQKQPHGRLCLPCNSRSPNLCPAIERDF